MISILKHRRLPILAAVAAIGVGCGTGEEPRTKILERWIDDTAAEVFKASDHQREVVVFTDRPGEENSRWRQAGEGSAKSFGQPWVADVELDAGEVDHIRVSVTHADPGFLKLRLSWAARGEKFTSERSQVVTASIGANPGTSHYRFELAEHRRWKGQMERLRLTAAFPAPLRLEKIVGKRAAYQAEKLPWIVARPWRVAVGNDSRTALVGVPGLPQTYRFTVPRNARMRLAYGVTGRSPKTISFQARLRSGRDDSELLNEVVAADEMPMFAWRPAEIDLGAWAGREVEIELMTGWDVPEGEVPALPLWANPELVAEVKEPSPRNVVLISIDTLRADKLSLYGHDRPTSPNLESWAAASAVVFDNAVVQASWTLPSHTSMLSGVGAFGHGVNYNNPAPASMELVSETLRDAGYKTLAVTGGGYVHPHYNLSQGFDRFWYWSGIDPATGAPLDGADHELDTVLGTAEGWLRETADEPFFLFLHTYDIHYRLRPREPFFSQLSELEAQPSLRWGRVTPTADTGFRRDKFLVLRGPDGETPLPEEMAALPADIYDSRISHLDSVLPRFFHLLEELGLADDTIIVLTSDHGELLGEHDLFGHLSLYDENLMVPLVIAAPGIAEPGRRIADQVRSIDIVPTILELTGAPINAAVEGESLVDLLVDGTDARERPAWSYAAASNFGMSLRTANRSKLIFNNTAWSAVNGDLEFYRLDEDRHELEDLGRSADAEPLTESLVDRYLGQVTGVRARFANPSDSTVQLLLEGSVLQEVGVKSVDADCDECVELEARGKVAVTLPAGRGLTLNLEEIGGPLKPLVVDARRAALPVERRRVEIDIAADIGDGLLLLWTDAGWRRHEGNELPTDAVGVALSRVGTWPETPSEATVDDELTERLRVLGYIE